MVMSFHHSLVYLFPYIYHIQHIPHMVDTENQKIKETDLTPNCHIYNHKFPG